MTRLHRQPICVASALIVPFLAMASPPWLAIDGVGPAWAVLWLLPWALVDGPVSGALSGVALGLVLDGLNLGGVSQVPALLLLGLSLIHISEPTRLRRISYAVFCLKKKK